MDGALCILIIEAAGDGGKRIDKNHHPVLDAGLLILLALFALDERF